MTLPRGGDGQLEDRQRLRKIALSCERLRRRSPPPPLAGKDGLGEQDHPRPLRDPARQPGRAHHLREHDVWRHHVLRQAPRLHVAARHERRMPAKALVVQLGRLAQRAFRQRRLCRVLGLELLG